MNQKLSPAKELAVRWAFMLEFHIDSNNLHPTPYAALLDLLDQETKNPLNWTEEECEEFLAELSHPPCPPREWGLVAKYLAMTLDKPREVIEYHLIPNSIILPQ